MAGVGNSLRRGVGPHRVAVQEGIVSEEVLPVLLVAQLLESSSTISERCQPDAVFGVPDCQ